MPMPTVDDSLRRGSTRDVSIEGTSIVDYDAVAVL
jgi:hypothetical protein